VIRKIALFALVIAFVVESSEKWRERELCPRGECGMIVSNSYATARELKND
jgi:hypothetical protein